MRRFSFPLQQLLDLRTRAQDEAQLQFADTQREALRERQRLEQLSAACVTAAEATQARPGQRLQPAMLINNGLHLARLHAATVGQTVRVQQCGQREEARRQELLVAAQQREALERLKQRRYETHLADTARAESRELDETSALMFVRQRSSE